MRGQQEQVSDEVLITKLFEQLNNNVSRCNVNLTMIIICIKCGKVKLIYEKQPQSLF